MLSFVSRSIVLLFTLLCINHLPALGQHKAWRQYTIADGLPGNQVYDMLQDSKGYMWFVTDKGICRFNGYEFFQPVDTTSWSGTEAFLPVEDDKGRIWFNRINQSLWFIEHDTVKEWEYNHVLEHYRADFNRIDQLGFADDGSVWLGLSAIGFLVVAPDGHHKIIHESPYPNVIFTRLKNRIVHALQFTTKQRSTLPKYKVAEVISMVGDQVTVVD